MVRTDQQPLPVPLEFSCFWKIFPGLSSCRVFLLFFLSPPLKQSLTWKLFYPLSKECLLFLLQKIPFIPTKIEHRCTQFGTLFHIQQAKFWNGYKTNMLWCNSNSTWKKLIINLQKVGLRGIKVVFSTEYCLKMNGKVAILSKPLKTQSASFTTCHMEKRLCDKERHDVQ